MRVVRLVVEVQRRQRVRVDPVLLGFVGTGEVELVAEVGL